MDDGNNFSWKDPFLCSTARPSDVNGGHTSQLSLESQTQGEVLPPTGYCNLSQHPGTVGDHVTTSGIMDHQNDAILGIGPMGAQGEHFYNSLLPNDIPSIDDIEPSFNTPIASIGQYIHTFRLEFLDLKNRIFEKQQSRKDKIARQLIINGKVKIAIQTSREVQQLNVWVRRDEKAVKAFNDLNEETQLEPPIKLHQREVILSGIAHAPVEVTEYTFQVDLASVYNGKYMPVYKLSRVFMDERNRFQLIAQALFVDQEYSEKVFSETFLIRTSKSNSKEPAIPGPWNTCPPSSKRRALSSKESPIGFSEPDSSVTPEASSSPLTQVSWEATSSASNMDHLIVKHLDAQRANIDDLNIKYINTRRGDIAYHVELNDPKMCKNLKKGQVVGLFVGANGNTTIKPLSTENQSQAIMAGVITRNAWVRCETPKKDKEGKTDVVCVIGMVPVNVVGTVRAGDRVYSSTDYPGCAIPESHLPLGFSFTSRNHTMLGMAMESCTPRSHHQSEPMLIKCFVCIVLGISGQQLTREVENVLESMEMDMSVKIEKSSKKSCRRTYCLVGGIVMLLLLLGVFLYEYFYPGSALRYLLCKQGSIPGHELFYQLRHPYSEKDVEIRNIQFEWEKIKKKMTLEFPRFSKKRSKLLLEPACVCLRRVWGEHRSLSRPEHKAVWLLCGRR